jgi:RimJ/RimL family protein N-acetyltransferase
LRADTVGGVHIDFTATEDVAELEELVRSDEWPHHAGGGSATWVGPGIQSFWVLVDGERAGAVRLYDLDDGGPMFDLRLRTPYRGRGIGTEAVRWLTGRLFTELPGVNRIEATTRSDNRSMRRVLGKCGYQLESRYREAWPVPGGPPRDAVGYAILRSDWAAGRTADPGLGRPLVELACVVVDCREAEPVARFWAAATGGEIVRRDADSAWLEVGGRLVIWREVPEHRPPTWPAPDVPLQSHLDFFIDDLDAAEAALLKLGARPAPHSPPREEGLVVLLDPAGHPFCIGTRL